MGKRYLKQIVSVAMMFSVLFVSVLHNPARADAISKVTKKGMYTFGGDHYVKCTYKNGYIIIKKTKNLTVAYNKKDTKETEFDWCGFSYRDVYDSCKFKLANKIYRYDWEDPVHTVKKFGFKLSVTSGKTISKSQLIERETSYSKNPVYIVLNLIVKNGKVVALGSGA